VLGELFLRNPILPGATDSGQLELIVERCGPLNDETMPGWRDLPGLPGQEGRKWDKVPQDQSIRVWAKSSLKWVTFYLVISPQQFADSGLS